MEELLVELGIVRLGVPWLDARDRWIGVRCAIIRAAGVLLFRLASGVTLRRFVSQCVSEVLPIEVSKVLAGRISVCDRVVLGGQIAGGPQVFSAFPPWLLIYGSGGSVRLIVVVHVQSSKAEELIEPSGRGSVPGSAYAVPIAAVRGMLDEMRQDNA